MKLKPLSIAGALLVVLVSSVPGARPQAPVGFGAVSGQSVTQRSFLSAALGREMPYMIVLPVGYSEGEQRYPVLYLFHGWQGDETNWVKLTHLVQDTAPYPLIVVTPRAQNSWYVNSAVDSAERFEDYVTTDLIADVDAHFRTIAASHARAVAGLSMGGYGALLLTLKHPGMFGFAASISGAFTGPTGIEGVLPQLRGSTDRAFGPPGSATRAENNLDTLISAAEPATVPYLFLQCGAGDALLRSNRGVVAELSEHKIAYEYHEFPGEHTWTFWDNALPPLFKVLAEHFHLPSTPEPATVLSAQPSGARRKVSHVQAPRQ